MIKKDFPLNDWDGFLVGFLFLWEQAEALARAMCESSPKRVILRASQNNWDGYTSKCYNKHDPRKCHNGSKL